jgi:hypothetical protein
VGGSGCALGDLYATPCRMPRITKNTIHYVFLSKKLTARDLRKAIGTEYNSNSSLKI